MKASIVCKFSLPLALVLEATAPGALVYDYTGPAMEVPDNNATGLAFTFKLSDTATEISSIAMDLNISGGFTGDLYAYLSHGAGFAVLLNRVGVGEATTGSSANGYLDTGFLITLSSGAGQNIHFYQNSGAIFNVSGQLTGEWQSDGRFIDPDSAPSTFDAAGSTGLDGFTGLNPNGDWTLFFSDLSPGGVSTVNSFSISVAPAPEPVPVALGIFSGFASVIWFRNWIRRHRSAAT